MELKSGAQCVLLSYAAARRRRRRPGWNITPTTSLWCMCPKSNMDPDSSFLFKLAVPSRCVTIWVPFPLRHRRRTRLGASIPRLRTEITAYREEAMTCALVICWPPRLNLVHPASADIRITSDKPHQGSSNIEFQTYTYFFSELTPCWVDFHSILFFILFCKFGILILGAKIQLLILETDNCRFELNTKKS